jgi:hypothetical protein
MMTCTAAMAGAAVRRAAVVRMAGVARHTDGSACPSSRAGSYSVVAFRVPTERDDASTVRVSVTFPQGAAVPSVSTTRCRGAVATRVVHSRRAGGDAGSTLTEVVDRVTCDRDRRRHRPGQFETSRSAYGPLPVSVRWCFGHQQRYSSGER